MAKKINDSLLWLDMEMSGLDVNKERILELAVILGSGDLNEQIEGPDLVIHQDDSLLDGMDDWNTEHHGKSGLIKRVQASSLSESEAEETVLNFLKEHAGPGELVLAGNSVHQDRYFLKAYMPKLENYLHYRNIDVSTFKELARRWRPELLAEAPVKKGNHRAMDDIRESIEELKFYKQRFCISSEE